jgi:hypothetical protein
LSSGGKVYDNNPASERWRESNFISSLGTPIFSQFWISARRPEWLVIFLQKSITGVVVSSSFF